MRVCTSCGKEKDETDFPKRKIEEGKCKWCRQNEADKRFRERNREKLNQKKRIYNLKNKDKIIQYRKKNAEKIKTYNKEYREKNNDKRLIYLKRRTKQITVFSLAKSKRVSASFFRENIDLFNAYRDLLLLKRLINEKRTGTQG